MRKKDKNEDIEQKKHPIFKAFIKLIIIIVLLIILLFGISFYNWKPIAEVLILNTPSIVLDSDGNEIAKIGATRNTETIKLHDLPNNLKNAYIAIEDQRFYKHFGVDIKRTTAAIASYIIHLGNASFGGSSITQQLVKNLTGDMADNPLRKVSEWSKAISLELFMTKDEILETYLNIIYTGPNIYGVQKASEYYFSKNIQDLSLAECAYIAGINIAPNAFNPFGEKDNTEKIAKRVTTVLNKMKELGYIKEDEYTTAINEVKSGIIFKQTKMENNNSGVYSYHTDALINEVIKDLSKEKRISKECAENLLNLGGLTIQSTQNSTIQTIVEKEFEKNI